MTVRWKLLVVSTLTATSLALGPSGSARASCNTIPERPVFLRGALGATDRPFARAGAGDMVQLRGACGSPRPADFNRDGTVDQRDLMVTIIFKPVTGAPPHSVVITARGGCAAVNSGTCCFERLFSHAGIQCFEAKPDELTVEAGSDAAQLRFKFPDTEWNGPATIAVTATGRQPPLELETRRCADFSRDDLSFCIDELYQDVDGKCTTTRADLHPMFSQFMGLPPSNDYREICSATPTGDPKCKGGAESLRLSVMSDGTMVIPMRWTNILKDKPDGSGKDRRWIQGSSAIEAFKDSGSPIVIPSAAFLESFGDTGVPFLHRPKFVPIEPRDRPNELTLSGTADKHTSQLRIAPRKPWEYTCSGGARVGQACEPQPQDHADEVDCDLPGTCSVQSAPRLFTCLGGEHDTRPCTRPRHCPHGKCLPGSTKCHPVLGASTGKDCTTDADCGSGQECGPALFELRDRFPTPTAEQPLPRKVSGGFRGVCDGGAKMGQICGSAWSCYQFPFGFADCVTYRTEAGKYDPEP
jgi:hypothetical protein